MASLYGGRWHNVKTLGAGGQAEIYLVQDKNADDQKQYALKRLRNDARIGHFRNEVEAVSRLDHPNIARLVDYSLEPHEAYFVMDYYEGGSLDKAVAFWRVSPASTLSFFKKICEAVAYAHSKGVIHRDLKPPNILLREPGGEPIVSDFGIAHVEDGERYTMTDEAMGSKYYIAPELADGRVASVDKRSDTYSLGKLLYWLFTGNVFARENLREAQWDLKGKRNGLGRWDRVYLEHVNRLLDRMITFNPNDRDYVADVGERVIHLSDLIRREFNPLAPDTMDHQRCYYCGYGYYELVAANDTKAENYGFKGVGKPDWRVMICRDCGHVQAFRVHEAKQKSWWSKKE